MKTRPYKRQASEVINAIKKIMKTKNLKYAELARYLNLSVPAIKRIMTADEIPLSRLLSICDFIGVELEGLLRSISDSRADMFYFSEEQELFFAKNPTYLAYFFELYSGRLKPLDIEKKHKISRRSTLKYLRKLEEMKLIQRGDDSKIKVHAKGVICWDDHGVLGRTFSKQMILSLAQRVAMNLSDPKRMMVQLHGWMLTPENYNEFKKEYQELADRYRQLSSFNRKILAEEEYTTFSVMALADAWDEPMFREVKEI